MVPASVVMLLVVAALLSPGGGWPKRIFAVVFIALAGVLQLPRPPRHGGGARQPAPGAESVPAASVAGQKVLALTSDRFTDYGLRSGRGLQPGIQLRDPGSLGGDEEPTPADRLRLGAREGAQRLPVRGHDQRDLPEPGPARVDPGEVHRPRTVSGSEPGPRRRSRISTRRRGQAGCCAATGRSWRRSRIRRAGSHLAASTGDRQAPLLEGGRPRRRAGEGGVATAKSAPIDNRSPPARQRARRSTCHRGVGRSRSST